MIDVVKYMVTEGAVPGFIGYRLLVIVNEHQQPIKMTMVAQDGQSSIETVATEDPSVQAALVAGHMAVRWMVALQQTQAHIRSEADTLIAEANAERDSANTRADRLATKVAELEARPTDEQLRETVAAKDQEIVDLRRQSAAALAAEQALRERAELDARNANTRAAADKARAEKAEGQRTAAIHARNQAVNARSLAEAQTRQHVADFLLDMGSRDAEAVLLSPHFGAAALAKLKDIAQQMSSIRERIKADNATARDMRDYVKLQRDFARIVRQAISKRQGSERIPTATRLLSRIGNRDVDPRFKR